ncbi:MAG TPA: SprT family zinc-dependent metalloprotease [bacterium]|nr:SprT family zinc-dependent metalloprotease [bacterium]
MQRPPCVLLVDDLDVWVRRKAMRTLRLSLGPDAQIRVSAPLSSSDAAITAFVRGHRAWIEARRLELLDQGSQPRFDYLDGDTLPFWGDQIRLKVLTGGKVGRAVLAQPGVLELRLPEGSTRRKRQALVRRWLGRELLAAAAARLPAWQAAMGVGSCLLRVRFMSSRWGSCNARTGVVTLAGQLAQKPAEALDYILVHELAHFKVRSHGVRFKSILDRHMPDWRLRRRRLNTGSGEGAAMERDMRREEEY